MKTITCKDIRPLKSEARREDSLYPNVGELKRLTEVYERLALDYGVLRAEPPDREDIRRWRRKESAR